MKTISFIVLLISWLPLNAAAENSERVTVRFIEPEKYTDVSLSGSGTERMRNYVLDTLRDYLAGFGQAHLAARQTLAIDILDIDMAGAYEPWRAPLLDNVRIMRDVYRPRIELRYVWRDGNGVVLAAAEENLTDLNYLQLADPGYLNNDPLKYEKTLLRRWFEQRFTRAARNL